MAIIDDTYRSDRPEAGPTGQGFGAMASPGYFSRPSSPPPAPAPSNTPTAAPGLLPSQEAMAATTSQRAGGSGGWSDAARPPGGTGGWSDGTPPPYTPTADPAFPNMYGDTSGVSDSGAYGPSLGRAAKAIFSAPGETVAASAASPRGPIQNAASQYSADAANRNLEGGVYPGNMTQSAPAAGPIAGTTTMGPADQTQPVNVDDARARELQRTNIISALAAQDERGMQRRNASQIAQANAADAGQAANLAAGNARVANWRATNGADMVLAGSNQAYNSQRQGIINAAGQANAGSVIANKAAQDANTAAAQPVGNPIQDNATTQETIQKGEQAIRQNKTADLQNQLGQQTVEHGKATQSLLAQLSNPKLSAKDRQLAQQSYLVALGKDPAQYKVEHSNGPPVLDSLGQLHPGPQYVHIVNTTTGETQTMKNEPDKAAAPYPNADAAHADAKAAVAAGMKLDEVNKRLQAAGYPPLQ